MAMRPDQWVSGLAVVAAVVALAFAAAIVLAETSGVWLHEVAGGVLLIVTVGILLAVRRVPARRSRLFALAGLALVVLVALGALGAGLASGVVSPSLEHLPLVVLALYAAVCLGLGAVARTSAPVREEPGRAPGSG